MKINKNVRKKLFDEGISQLIDWVGNKNWTVDFDYCARDQIDPNDKVVSISIRQGPEKQLYSFLHECGHILIQCNEDKYEKNFPIAAKINKCASNKRLEKTSKYKVDCIAEEIEAWRRGKNLAERLSIFIDEENYNNLMAECVYTYINWAAE